MTDKPLPNKRARVNESAGELAVFFSMKFFKDAKRLKGEAMGVYISCITMHLRFGVELPDEDDLVPFCISCTQAEWDRNKSKVRELLKDRSGWHIGYVGDEPWKGGILQ